MKRLSKRELHRKLDDLEAQQDPGACTFLFSEHIGDDDIVQALAADFLARNGNQGINIVSTDPESFKERVASALTSLQKRDGVALGLEPYIAFLAGRRTAEIPSGQEGVDVHFDTSVMEAQINRVWRETVEAAT